MIEDTLFEKFEKNPLIAIIILLIGSNAFFFKLYLSRTNEYIKNLKQGNEIAEQLNKILMRLRIKSDIKQLEDIGKGDQTNHGDGPKDRGKINE